MNYPVDPDRQTLHEAALILARDQGMGYLEAVAALSEPPAPTDQHGDPASQAIHELIGTVAEKQGKTYGQVVEVIVQGREWR